MRKMRWTLTLLALTASGVWTQQTPPQLIHAVAAVYPTDPGSAGLKHICMLDVIVGADGTPEKIQVLGTHPSPFDAAAISAVKQSTFAPGKLHGTPLTAPIHLYVPFNYEKKPAVPQMLPIRLKGMEPPRVLYWVKPEYTDEARRAGLQGIVLVSVLVTEDGLPTDAHVIRDALGKGLDEKAVEAVNQDRFRPATVDGVPLAFPITMELNFQLGR